MRIRSKGFGAPPPALQFDYNGTSVEAQAGDTIASALIASGTSNLRVAAPGDNRGVFCGMGVCHECTVVEGASERLACMTPVAAGTKVKSHTPALDLSGCASTNQLPESTLTPDVLVIGAGPAGLAAAAFAAESGCDVVLVDERGKLGGQYFKQPAPEFDIEEAELDGQYRRGRELIARVRASGLTVLHQARVWGAFDPDHVVAAGPDQRWVIRASRIILATGAYERGVPMPGWTLPGVMTTGAAQTLSRSQQVAPGQRVLVAGNGPLNIQVAAELAASGAKVVGLVELASPFKLSNILAAVRMFFAAPDLVFDGARYALTLARNRVPVTTGSAVIKMNGESGKVAEAIVAKVNKKGTPRTDRHRSFEVDAVCVGYGFLPSNEVARMLGCHHSWDEQTQSLVADRDETGRTSVREVWVVGDSAGVQGARVANSMGVLAAEAIVRDLGRATPPAGQREVATARRMRERNLRFQRSMQKVFDAPVLTHQLATPSTTICRCENVSLGRMTEDIDDIASTPGATKRLSRAGMGKCQGRYCGPVLLALSAERKQEPITERSGFAPQVPFKPTPISEMADPE